MEKDRVVRPGSVLNLQETMCISLCSVASVINTGESHTVSIGEYLVPRNVVVKVIATQNATKRPMLGQHRVHTLADAEFHVIHCTYMNMIMVMPDVW